MTTTSPKGFDNSDMKSMQKKLDKMMDRKMDSLQEASGGKWKRVN